VEDRDLRALRRQRPRARLAEARRAASDDGGDGTVDLHLGVSCLVARGLAARRALVIPASAPRLREWSQCSRWPWLLPNTRRTTPRVVKRRRSERHFHRAG